MYLPHPRSLTGFFLVLACAGALLPSSLSARDRLEIPPPGKVVRDIRGFIHRMANGVKDASKQTWSAVRERFTERDEEGAEPPDSRRPESRSRNPDSVSLDHPPYPRSKDAVPYRYDDADTKTSTDSARTGSDAMPKVNIIPHDPSKTGPFTSPAEQTKPQTDVAPLPPKTTEPPDDDKIEFGRPVPGKRGLVYPPGTAEGSENMVDVEGFPSGQIVRDPRTGKLFRVP